MNDSVTVIKIGGNEVDDPRWVASLASTIAALRGSMVLVHGGGKEISELQRALGAEPQWRDGRRVTTPEALRAVSMVLSGLVNKRLVAALVGAGVRAVGISGEDAGTLRAELLDGGRMGHTGAIREVDTDVIRTLLAAGILPVLSPVSRGEDGGPLNVNADDAAAAVAAALGADRFLMVSNVPGVLWTDAVLDEVTVPQVEELIGRGIVAGGMAPKLRAAARAAAAGLGEVRIGGLDTLTDPAAGTAIVHHARPAAPRAAVGI